MEYRENICHVFLKGQMNYTDALSCQNQLSALRKDNKIPNTLLLLEHPPTYTLGRKSNKAHFQVPKEWIQSKKVAVHQVDRGGEITYHGPGQLIGYPILHLGQEKKQIVLYVRKLEDMLIHCLQLLGVESDRFSQQDRNGRPTGVWLREGKVASIGIKVDKDMISSHGFALNVCTDLNYFKKIIPCGILNKDMVSLQSIGYTNVSLQDASEAIMQSFEKIFGFELIKCDL